MEALLFIIDVVNIVTEKLNGLLGVCLLLVRFWAQELFTQKWCLTDQKPYQRCVKGGELS